MRPRLISLSALALVTLLVAPWGDFPLNDDWIYSHVAKRFAEEGVIRIEATAASAMVGQVLIATPVIKLFGFSHVSLRILTIMSMAVLLLLLDRLMVYGGVSVRARCMALLAVVFNPIVAHATFSFATEIYGALVAFTGVVVWFQGRARSDTAESDALISWNHACASALLIGSSFWIRQFCIGVFPGLLLSAFIASPGRLRKSWRQISAASLVLALMVAGYFAWTRWSGNSQAASFAPVGNVLSFNPSLWIRNSFLAIPYLTLYCAPLLLLFRPSRRLAAVAGAIGLVTFGLSIAWTMHRNGVTQDDFGGVPHAKFPYNRNVIYNAGVGPIPLSDVYLHSLPLRPKWDEKIWVAVGILIALLQGMWPMAFTRRPTAPRGRELIWFGVITCACTFALYTQARGMDTFDRYDMLLFLGLTLSLSALLGESFRPWAGIAVLAAIGTFTTLGVHDYFAWQQARWDLFRAAQAKGIAAANIDGGWEINGWMKYVHPPYEPVSCIGPCDCRHKEMYCQDDSYRIGMNVYDGYQIVQSIQPVYWLAGGPPVLLSRRPVPKP